MYKAIKEIDTIVVIIKYKQEEDEEELVEENEIRVRVMVKHVLLNYEEASPKYLRKLQKFFLNGCPNRRKLFSKF